MSIMKSMQRGVFKRTQGEFPESLKSVKPLVEQVFWKAKGWDESIFEKCVAIVGSRKMTSYGRTVVGRIVPELVVRGYTTVSGLMEGIDIEVHRSTYMCGGRTIGVLGWGIDHKANEETESLERELLLAGSLVISEYEGTMGPNRATFPQRNRIVTGLASEVIVVEAEKASGSLISAHLALKQGKKLWAVPGPIDSKMSEGTNQLIKDGLASMLTLDELDLCTKRDNFEKNQHNLRENERKIFELIGENSGMMVGEVARRLKTGVGEVGILLSEMEMRGVVQMENGRYRVREEK